jgi:diguanylate cyclase (GGDEF)-like protein
LALSSFLTERPKLKRIFQQLIAGLITLIVLFVVFGLFLLCGLDHIVEQLELKTYDFRAQSTWWGQRKHSPSSDILILQFDDLSFKLLNEEYGEWPWPRDVHADMIGFLNRAGAKMLLYDIMFVAHQRGNKEADAKLGQAFHQADNVYLSLNLDNDLAESRALGKDLTPQDIELLKPLSIEIRSELEKTTNSALKLQPDLNGGFFFDNEHMTFNHFRAILPELMSKKRNIAIINHGSDPDGISRGNPLFFRFQYQPFVKSSNLPIRKVGDGWQDQLGRKTDANGYLFARSSHLPALPQKDGTYVDQNPQSPRRVDPDGYLLDSYGHYIYERENNLSTLYFPYLGLKAVLDLKFPGRTPALTITRNGYLKFPGYSIPLRPNGDFLVNWYNVDIKKEEYRRAVKELRSARKKTLAQIQVLTRDLEKATTQQAKQDAQKQLEMRQNELKQIDHFLPLFEKELEGAENIPQPYRTISAWKVIRAMKKEQARLPLDKDDIKLKEQLKNKIVFIGATAVAAYDVKNTPVYATMPGVQLQANLFDNLYQNKGYIRSLRPGTNLLILVLICLFAAACVFRLRSAWAGMLTVANIAILYVVISLLLFHQMQIWINTAMPLTALVITTTITFMVKYALRDRDYEKTYALATTDSMTGLYNHRFFQEHMRRSIEQSNRFKHKFSLILIDIDFFKKFNDTYGHQAGDEVLRHVARKLKKTVRTVDVVARYGGEEMAIILDRTNEEEALAVAHKVVKAVAEEAYPIAEGVSKHVTISCGVATYPTHGDDVSQLIEFADAGLYRAKENGRNQVGAQYDSPDKETGESKAPADHHH